MPIFNTPVRGATELDIMSVVMDEMAYARAKHGAHRPTIASIPGIVRFLIKYAPENSATFLHDQNALSQWPRRVAVQRQKWLEAQE